MINFFIFHLTVHASSQVSKKPRRALVINVMVDGYMSRCFGEQSVKVIWKKQADHLIAPINALRSWSRNYTESGESFFDVVIFTRSKFSSQDPIFSAHAGNKTKNESVCNREGSSLFPSDFGKFPRCCILDQERGPQGNQIFRGELCGCPSNRDQWGENKKCKQNPSSWYMPYFSVVEHGGTKITPWIDGPKGEEVGDFVVNNRFDFFEGGISIWGLFFSGLFDLNPDNVQRMIRDNGSYLQKPTYKIMKKYNITELYFSGWGDHGIHRAIEEAQALNFTNITVISDAFDGSLLMKVKTFELNAKNKTHEENKNEYLDMLRKMNVPVKTATEIAQDANEVSGRNKTLDIQQPVCMDQEVSEPKRALLVLDVQEGLVSSCTHSEEASDVKVPDTHRIVPRINAFLEWVYQKKDFFSQIHFTQTQFAINRPLDDESEYPLAKDLVYDMKSLHGASDNISVHFSSRSNSNNIFFGKGYVSKRGPSTNNPLLISNGSLRSSKFRLFRNNPPILKILQENNIKELYLAGVALDDTIIKTARQARALGFSVYILTDLTQARDLNLKEGPPRESLMRYYYNLADEEDIFSLKTTDLSEEYFAVNGLSIPFKKWMDEDGCVNTHTLEEFPRSRSTRSTIISFLIISSL